MEHSCMITICQYIYGHIYIDLNSCSIIATECIVYKAHNWFAFTNTHSKLDKHCTELSFLQLCFNYRIISIGSILVDYWVIDFIQEYLYTFFWVKWSNMLWKLFKTKCLFPISTVVCLMRFILCILSIHINFHFKRQVIDEQM